MKKQQNDTCEIPRDVLENILSRLPVKSLLRFKTVSKSWNAVIEDPGFARTHSKQSNISNSQCFFTDYDRDAAYSLIRYDGHEFYRESIGRFQLEENTRAFFLCGCEGILVFKYNTYNRETETTCEMMFLLLNPFTRNLSTLSCPYDVEKNTKRICDSEGYGLCLDKYEDDYKFVAVLGGGKIYLVYSFRNESWVERRSEVGRCVSREGTYVNGVVYWLVSTGGIVYFDPKDDLLKKLHAVPYQDLKHERFHLTNLRGNLCLFACDLKYVFEIWLLKEDQHQIAKGGNGTIVFEENHQARAVVVKRPVKAYDDMASQEIQNLILSDVRQNIVRWYGVEQDQDFVSLSLERCNLSLNDLILMLSKSTNIAKEFKNQLDHRKTLCKTLTCGT
ncbi:F-box protein At2g23160-like [Henckelia pumila]|uniref:F-box protein At2g23160-like n=1 Tax=Henckelia pumila TaxID=405737 RepID=UPI003C6E7871